MRRLHGLIALIFAHVIITCSSLPTFVQLVPNANQVPGYSHIGHSNDVAGAPRNSFGLDFIAAGKKWTTELCNKDSDGDGFTNGFELGDPNCEWSPENPTELRMRDLSHPGLSESVPNENSTDDPNGSPPFGEYDATYGYNLWTAHAVLMVLSFGLLLPVAMIYPVMNSLRRREDNLWLRLHRGQLSLALFMATIGFLIAMFNIAMRDQTLTRMTSNVPHGPIGIALIVSLWIQAFLGYNRPHLPLIQGETKSFARKLFEVLHPLLGRAIFILSMIQLWYGYQNLTVYSAPDQSQPISIWSYFQVILTPIIWFAITVYCKRKSRKDSRADGVGGRTTQQQNLAEHDMDKTQSPAYRFSNRTGYGEGSGIDIHPT